MSNKQWTVGIYTLGCKVNQYESEAIAEELSRLGASIASHSDKCDAYIINTCTVTAESDRKARQFIRRAISQNPSAVIAVTGCLAQTAKEALCSVKGIDAIIGNTEKLLTAKIVLELLEKGKKSPSPVILVGDVENAPFENMSISRFDRTRAYVKIEDGCENRCTYCIIPSARGKVRSKLPEHVLREVECLTCGGCREVVLTGIETASYGKDLESGSLSSLLSEVDKIEGIGRIRLGSLDPSLIKEGFADGISELRSLAPHFHLSLQSGSNRILALMKRKYNREQALKAITLLRDRIPEVKFTTDVIVGFPGETESDFADTYDFIKTAKFLNVHIFPYSKRNGTLAAKMEGQIPEDVKKTRLHKLEALVSEIRSELLSEEIALRPIKEVLFETYKDGYAYGHTPDFIEVRVPAEKELHARVMSVRLIGTDGSMCFGELL